MSAAVPIILASASPRRRTMLEAAGYDIVVRPPASDDSALRPGDLAPRALVVAMAYFKASQVAAEAGPDSAVVLGADTVCVHEGRILGKPADAEGAREAILALRGATHETMTGVALVCPADGRRVLFVDVARVTVGALDALAIDAYVAADEWRGKAGGYNLADRVAAGWPIRCAGDPATVMGLPMRRLPAALAALRARAGAPGP